MREELAEDEDALVVQGALEHAADESGGGAVQFALVECHGLHVGSAQASGGAAGRSAARFAFTPRPIPMSDAAAGGGSAGAALRAGMVDDFAIEGCPAPVGRYQSVAPTLADQYRSIDHLLRRPSPFANETYAPTACGEFEPGEAVRAG